MNPSGVLVHSRHRVVHREPEDIVIHNTLSIDTCRELVVVLRASLGLQQLIIPHNNSSHFPNRKTEALEG